MRDDIKYPPVEIEYFNLWDEPWIDVLFCDGTNGLLSLSEVFDKADEIKDICEELPIQDISILRLLICIVHASADVTNDNWMRWYDRRALPLDDIDRYREQHHDEFYLFHPEKPFMQVADLTFANEEKSTLSNKTLLYDYPTDDRIMRCRNKDSIDALSCAEAARLVVTAQNYDVCGVHTPMKGEVAKAGKSYPTLASLAHNTVIVLEGDNLLETLLYNTVPSDVKGVIQVHKKGIIVHEDDLPAWDANATSDLSGPCSVLSRQSRRIRLIPDFLGDHSVAGTPVSIGAMVGTGDEVVWNDKFPLEDMSIFRHFTDKETGDSYYKPAYFSKQPYKELYSRIVGNEVYRAGDAVTNNAGNNINTARADKSPIDKLSNNMYFAQWLLNGEDSPEDFDRRKMLSFRTVTVSYGTMESVITKIADDRTRISPYSLSGRNSGRICASILDAIDHIDKIESYYRRFLKNAEQICAPSSLLDARADELNKMKLALEETFQAWLEQDVPVFSDDKEKREELWKQRIWDTVRRVMNEYLSTNAHVKDFIGYCDEDGKEHSICKEESFFYYNVKTHCLGKGNKQNDGKK